MRTQTVSIIKKIKALAKDVYQTLGSGFSEVVYDRAMQVGFRLAKIKYETQRVVQLTYKKHHVGEGYPDLVVHAGKEKIVVELKSIAGDLGPPEEQQLKNYMRYLKIPHGVLINFQYPPYRKEGKTKLEIKEVYL